MTHHQFLLARVHRPHALRKLGLGLCHAGVLSEVLCPRVDPHFRPEGARMFEDFVDTVEKSPIAQKDQPKLFRQGKELLPVFRTND